MLGASRPFSILLCEVPLRTLTWLLVGPLLFFSLVFFCPWGWDQSGTPLCCALGDGAHRKRYVYTYKYGRGHSASCCRCSVFSPSYSSFGGYCILVIPAGTTYSTGTATAAKEAYY